jgi:hypothetical protein
MSFATECVMTTAFRALGWGQDISINICDTAHGTIAPDLIVFPSFPAVTMALSTLTCASTNFLRPTCYFNQVPSGSVLRCSLELYLRSTTCNSTLTRFPGVRFAPIQSLNSTVPASVDCESSTLTRRIGLNKLYCLRYASLVTSLALLLHLPCCLKFACGHYYPVDSAVLSESSNQPEISLTFPSAPGLAREEKLMVAGDPDLSGSRSLI